MDELAPKQRRPWWLIIGGGIIAAGAAGAGLVYMGKSAGFEVSVKDLHVATVASAVFNDDIVVRTAVEPMVSVILDSIESGRVEEVKVKSGMMVKQGELLFRLSNPQRQLDMLARQSDYAQ